MVEGRVDLDGVEVPLGAPREADVQREGHGSAVRGEEELAASARAVVARAWAHLRGWVRRERLVSRSVEHEADAGDAFAAPMDQRDAVAVRVEQMVRPVDIARDQQLGDGRARCLRQRGRTAPTSCWPGRTST